MVRPTAGIAAASAIGCRNTHANMPSRTTLSNAATMQPVDTPTRAARPSTTRKRRPTSRRSGREKPSRSGACARPRCHQRRSALTFRPVRMSSRRRRGERSKDHSSTHHSDQPSTGGSPAASPKARSARTIDARCDLGTLSTILAISLRRRRVTESTTRRPRRSQRERDLAPIRRGNLSARSAPWRRDDHTSASRSRRAPREHRRTHQDSADRDSRARPEPETAAASHHGRRRRANARQPRPRPATHAAPHRRPRRSRCDQSVSLNPIGQPDGSWVAEYNSC